MKLQSRTDHGTRAQVPSGPSSSTKTCRTHNELHRELLLAHKRGVALSSRSELQQALERRSRLQRDRCEEARSPLEDELLRRQQHQKAREREEEEVRGEAQLMEFVRVRQNLRKIQDKVAPPPAPAGAGPHASSSP